MPSSLEPKSLTGIYVAFREGPCAFLAEPESPRHITPKMSPKRIGSRLGNFDTERHSIGSINDASVLDKESRRDWISLRIALFRKTNSEQISKPRLCVSFQFAFHRDVELQG